MGRIIDLFVDLFKPRKRGGSTLRVKSSRRETDWEYNKRKHTEQEEIDAILDKLKQSGYSSLSAEEKKETFQCQQEIKSQHSKRL